MKCPIAVTDGELNLENRNWAFQNVGYGPANPNVDDADFWQDRASEWATSVENAKTMRCANCAAFVQTPEMLECIAEHLGMDEDYPDNASAEMDANRASTLNASNLGYCQLFAFKCAAARTCSSWLSGGPITGQPSTQQKNMLAMAKLEYGR